MLTPTLLALLGFATTIGIIVVLLKNWTGPMIAFIMVPAITALNNSDLITTLKELFGDAY